jgi:SAM-dependent methyltransferase
VQSAFPIESYIGPRVEQEMLAIVRALEKHLSGFEGKQLLDLGCGPMDKTAVLSLLGFECSAVDDLSDPWHLRGDNVEKIESYARGLGIDFHRFREDDGPLPFQPESFDVACSLAVIEHLHESPRMLLNTMGTLLKTGGLLVVMMPNAVNLRKRLSVLMGRTNYSPVDQFFHSSDTWRGHVREYTLRETEYVVRATGFEILSSTTFESFSKQKLRFLPARLVYEALGNLVPSFKSCLLVIARRPTGWVPVDQDPELLRRALSRSVPEGIA